MKKTLLLLTVCVGLTAGAVNYGYYQYAGGTATAVSELVDGKQYVVYDNFSDRYAFRKATEGSERVGGLHEVVESMSEFTTLYVWTAIKNGDSWSFQNVYNEKYIPGLTGNNGTVNFSDTPGLFTMQAFPGTSDGTTFNLFTTGAESKCSWDGNNHDGYNDAPWSMAEWTGDGHPYKFYLLEEIPTVTVSYVKGSTTYWTESVKEAELTTSVLPETCGTLGTVENGAVTFTFADNAYPVKIAGARHQNQWATTNETGLYHTAAGQNFSTGEWFVKINNEDGFYLFAENAGKYVGPVGTDGDQVPLSDTPQTLYAVPNQNGPYGIVSQIGGNGFNLAAGASSAGNIAPWSVGQDASSHWFFVNDFSQFETNTFAGYYVPGVNDEGQTTYAYPYDGGAKFSNNNPWYLAQQAAIDAVAAAQAAGIEEAEIAPVQALIDEAKTVEFGFAGVVVADKIKALNDAATALQEKVSALKDITVNFVKDGVTYSTLVYKNVTPVFPSSLGTMSEVNDNDVATFTFADAVKPFKMVNARYNAVWATTNEDGLYHTSQADGSYDAGEFFMMDGAEDSFSIFSPIKGKYAGSFAQSAQVPFVADPAQFAIEHSQYGPVSIKGAAGSYMNDFGGSNAGNIGGWNTGSADSPDAGSFWFIVYDEEAYNINKGTYWDTTTIDSTWGTIGKDGDWYTAIQDAKDAITAATANGFVPAVDIDNLQTLVNNAMAANFGQAGVNIPAMLEQLITATTNLNNLTAGISEISVEKQVGNVIYDLQGRKVSATFRGLYIINGKKVLVK